MGFFPEIPPDTKQTNCWKFYFILVTVSYIITLISAIGQSLPAMSIIFYIIEYIIFVICLWHVAYTRVTISEGMIEITMGPWQWPLLSWLFSSQIGKEEIYLVENKRRECFYDVVPRLYCYPVVWCCCHKSYNSYFWPFCCDVTMCNLCDGDSDTSNYLVIYLTNEPMEFMTLCMKRCAPCPFPTSLCWCCVYNRIAVSINTNQNVVLQCENLGYQLRINQNITNVGMAGNDALGGYNQMGDGNGANTMGNGVGPHTGGQVATATMEAEPDNYNAEEPYRPPV